MRERGFGIRDSGFGVRGSGFGVRDSGFGTRGSGFDRRQSTDDWRQATRERGLSLLEVVLVVAVIAILASAVTPAVVQRILDSRIDATRAEVKALSDAMVGRPGEAAGAFGFVGDIGRLPQTFTELVQPGGLPAYTTNNVRSVGMGWKGPYVNVGDSPTDYSTDAFDSAYTGASLGQVRSAGPNGTAGDSDDIVYPPNPPVITGQVTVVLKTISGGKTVVDPANYDVKLYYASNGAEAVLTDSFGPFVFQNVPMGLHAIEVVKTTAPNKGSVVAQTTVVSLGGGQAQLVEVWF